MSMYFSTLACEPQNGQANKAVEPMSDSAAFLVDSFVFSSSVIAHFGVGKKRMIPDFITHYHLPDRPPFLSLSDLDGNIEDPVFLQMLDKHKHDSGYNRRYGKQYLKMRMEAETKLKHLFEKRGGDPKRDYPFYFVLGSSDWFRYLNSDHEEIRIDLKDLPRESVSITFPDSFIAMTVEDKDYYEQVYFIDELTELVKQHGLPKNERPETYDKYWVGDFEEYVEVQVWDDEVVEPFRKQWQCQQNGGHNSGSSAASIVTP